MTIEPTEEMINSIRAFVPAPCSLTQARRAAVSILAAAEASLARAVEEGGPVLYDDRTVIGKAYRRGFNDGSLDAERAAEVRES